MRRVARWLAVVAAIGAPRGMVVAQQVRGDVLLPDRTTRAAGVIIVITDRAGATVARALTGDGGEFELRLPRPGSFTLRALRIGFKPTLVSPVDVAGSDTATVHVVLNGDVVTLASITVKGENVCRVREDSGQLVARLWEEARKAITATQLSDRGKPLTATWYRYERDMDSLARVVRKQTVSTTTAVTQRPFISDPPESLARLGYVVDIEGEIFFRAPDADALLSDSFAGMHCFHVEPPRRDQMHLVGVGFRPAREREGIRDIEGTFWLDRNTAELRYLEFRFTNMIAAYANAGAGGRVEFLRLPTGHWLVSRWYLRMPLVKARPGQSFRNALRSEPIYFAEAIHITGGEVTEVRRDGVLLHKGGGATVDVEVVSRDSLVAVAGTTVDFDGTGYLARVDSTGRARLEHVLPGRYQVRVASLEMVEAGIPAVSQAIEVREQRDAAAEHFELPSSADLLQRACGPEVARRAEAMVFGTVRGGRGESVGGAVVTAGWQRFAKPGGDVLLARDEFRDVTADEFGRWRLCGVPRDQLLTVRATVGSRKYDAVQVHTAAARALQRISIALPAGPTP
jgi:hypothetical protein